MFFHLASRLGAFGAPGPGTACGGCGRRRLRDARGRGSRSSVRARSFFGKMMDHKKKKKCWISSGAACRLVTVPCWIVSRAAGVVLTGLCRAVNCSKGEEKKKKTKNPNPFLPKYLFWQGAKGSEPSCSLVPPAAPQARGQPLMSETGKKKKIGYELDPR